MSMLRRSILAGVAALAVLLGVSLLSSAPALAAAPETPVTEAPTANTTGTTATLDGELNPGLATEKVTYRFAYSAGSTAACTESGLTAPVEPFPEAEGNHEKVSTPVTGLEGSTEYTVCLIAANPAEPAESTQGNSVKFQTPTTKPVIPSETAPSVTPVGATLEAKINPEKQETSYRMEYASEAAKLGTPEATVITEGSFPGVSGEQTAGPVETGPVLTPDTTYYYRVVATNGTGTTDGEVGGKVAEFTTSTAEKPSIDSESVTGVTQTNAELHAAINPEYQETEYQFKLGTSTAYGVDAPAALTVLGGAGFFGDIEPVVNLNGEAITLAPNTEYHYEAVAKNTKGTTEGLTTPGIKDKTFLTLPNPPTVLTGEASEVTPYSAMIAGSVSPGSSGVNSDTTYYFQYSTDTSYNTQIPLAPADAGQGISPVLKTANLTGLQPDTTYHYRIVASNDNTNTEGGAPQIVYGQGREFKTTATPPILGSAEVAAITQSSASITATLEARGLPTRWELRLGSTPGSLELQAAGNTEGSAAEPLALNVGSLTPGTTYYYKLIAVNPDGAVQSTEAALTTAAAPNAANSLTQPPTPLLTLPNVEFPKEEAEPPKKTTNAEKLKKALKACGKKRSKSRRATCVRHARKEFGRSKK
jgi:hypothetical protein